MARKPRLNWDRLLDGGTYVLDLDDIGWPGGLNDLRSKAHYEADKRRGHAVTHGVSDSALEIRGSVQNASPRSNDPCTCGAPVWDFHIITCRSGSIWVSSAFEVSAVTAEQSHA